jgi:hypothetical protein
MPHPPLTQEQFKSHLDKISPGSFDAELGTWLYEISAQLTDLQAKHNALLARLDSANLAGMGTTNVAAFGARLRNTLPEDR